MSEKNVLIGILSIILGLIIIVFPLISMVTVGVLAGLGVIFLGFWLLLQAIKSWKDNMAAGIANIILALFAFLFGIVFIYDINFLKFITFFALYIVAFFLLLTGITALFSGKDIKARLSGVLGVVFALVFMYIAMQVQNIFYLAIVIGAFLIALGVMELFIGPPEFSESKDEA